MHHINMRFVTCDTWHGTHEAWHMVGGDEPFLKNFISLALTVWELEVAPDMLHLPLDPWYLTSVTWHTGGDEHCVKIPGCKGVLKIWKVKGHLIYWSLAIEDPLKFSPTCILRQLWVIVPVFQQDFTSKRTFKKKDCHLFFICHLGDRCNLF